MTHETLDGWKRDWEERDLGFLRAPQSVEERQAWCYARDADNRRERRAHVEQVDARAAASLAAAEKEAAEQRKAERQRADEPPTTEDYEVAAMRRSPMYNRI